MHENLRGKGIGLYDTSAIIEEVADFCEVNLGMRPVVVLHEIPQEFAEFLHEQNLQCAIIHTRTPQNCEPIIKAHESGLKIVYIRQMVPSTDDEAWIYGEFEAADIPYVAKGLGTHHTALNKLNNMLAEPANP